MICIHCGADIPDGEVVCPRCGTAVQIVPDYNPLEDVLAREVRGSVEGATRQIQTDDIRRYRRGNVSQNVNATRVLSQNEMSRLREERRNAVRRGQGGTQGQSLRRNTGEQERTRRSTGEMRRRQDTEELRRDRRQKRLEAAKRKRRNLLIALFCILALIVAGIYIAYQNSYTGMAGRHTGAVSPEKYRGAGAHTPQYRRDAQAAGYGGITP